MAIFRQYIAPLLIVLVFIVALVAVGARIFLPNDMAAPAPTEDVGQKAEVPNAQGSSAQDLEQLTPSPASVAELPPNLMPNLIPIAPNSASSLVPSIEVLVRGLPLDANEF
jgi:hypothetical protein